MKSTHTPKTLKQRNGFLSLLVSVICTVIIVFPFYWMTVTALKLESDIFKLPVTLVPENPTMANFNFAWTQTKIPIYFINSLIYVVCTVIAVLIFASFAAYSMSRFKFKGKAVYLTVVLLSQLMPMTTLIVPLYISFGKMNLINNRWALVAIYTAIQIPIALWLLLGYFNGIPRDIDEAAIIDGCSHRGVLFRMILPLAKPGIMAVMVSIIIFVWQEPILAMTFTNVDTMRPLMAGVSASVTKAGIKWGQLNATGVIACIPILIIYIFCQRYLVKGLTGGAVKG